MSVALVTGSAGLIGSQAARLFAEKGLDVVGVDNDMRRVFFGDEASTVWNRRRLERDLRCYQHLDADIRNYDAMADIFRRYGGDIVVVVHAAAQPSHDWAAREPLTDFSVNAAGTLNLLELARLYAPDVVFIFLSTNKVYGDTPNRLPLVEHDQRWEIDAKHPFHAHGIDETMNVDRCLHSLFGASKLAADVLVQEYGRYFGMKTTCFRSGCLTGPGHAAVELHGFLAYLMKCAVTGKPYMVYGYKGKQVRDNIHALDLVSAFWHVFQKPRVGEVYNIGGGRHVNCSMLEAIALCEWLTGRPMNWKYSEATRTGDHIWWVSDVRRFHQHYPDWRLSHDLESILREIQESIAARRTNK